MDGFGSPETTPIKVRIQRDALLGYAAALAVTLIWATCLVASRSGAKSSLTPYDLAALRYGVSASQGQIILQTLYQGLIPGLLGLLLVAYATRNFGPSTTAAFMAAVPTLGTVLGIVFLDEVPGRAGWVSLIVLTPGILLVAFYSRRGA